MSYTSTETIDIQHGLLDNLNKLVTTQKVTKIETKHKSEKNWLDEIEKKTGPSTSSLYLSHVNCVELKITNGALLSDINSITRQTREYIMFQQGVPISAFITAKVNTSNGTGSVSRLGLFDNKTGLFFSHSGNGGNGTMYVVRRYVDSSGVTNDVSIASGSWNIDKMDGTGPSGLTLSWSEIHTYYVESTWNNILRFGIQTYGKMQIVHEFNIQTTEMLLESSILPIRYSIDLTGNLTGDAILKHYTSYAIVDSKYDPKALTYNINNLYGGSKINSTFEKPILVLRHIDFANSRGIIKLKSVELTTTRNKIIYKLYRYFNTAATPVIVDSDVPYTSVGEISEYNMNCLSLRPEYDTERIILKNGIMDDTEKIVFDDVNKDYSFLSGDLSGRSDYFVVTCKLAFGVTMRSVNISLDFEELI